jgi:multiple sugar transport system substrate-binding protein
MASLIKNYEAGHPNVTINRTSIGFADFTTKLTQAAATGTFPDVAAIDNADIPLYAGQGTLADLTAQDKAWPELSQYLPAVSRSVSVGDKYYGVPFRSNTSALWYNKADFQQAGITSPPSTWADLVTDAKKLTSGKRAGFCFSAAATDEGTFTFLPVLWQSGGDVPSIGDQHSQAALNLLNTMVNVDHSAPRSVLQWGQSDVADQFGTGLCAMMVNGPYALPSVQKASFQWAVAPWPAGPSGTAAPLGGEALVVGGNSAHVDAAVAFAQWLADPANDRQQLTNGLGSIPNRKDTISNPAWDWQPMVKVFAQQMATARPRGVYGPQYQQISTAISTMEQQVLSGQASPVQAAQKAGATIKPLLGHS